MSSHVTILAAGTRGDVQPYVALALGLLDAGHDVTLAANAEFEAFARAYGVPFSPLRADYLTLADTPEGRAALKGNPLTASRRMRKLAAPMIRRMLDDAWVAAQDTDAIVHHPKSLAGPHLSERLGVPAYAACAVPMLTPTRAFPVPGLVKAASLGPALNHASYRLAAAAARTYKGTVASWREETLDLPHAPHGPRPTTITLYAYSEAVLPRPSDWRADTIVTGYWFLPPAPSWKPDPELQRFLGTGAPPVYVGFGSMPTEPGTGAQVVAALRRAGVRGLIAGMDIAPADDMLAVKDVPHEWLFERVAVTVHHGGAGTVGAGLRAGKPAVIVPQGVDQPFWARAVHTTGAAPKPVDDLTHLADAITAATRLTPCAADLGRLLRREHSTHVAVAQLGGAAARLAA
ncbi:glycosyltransferase [Solirubrobacter ginsenosidimutans]|uniref:Glycosyltransferase n=1 Tax=Solirubrobacter ginsenosidimutans TaxID=490573 RepID=A0A9X3S0U2_9ACTN|nr:glycosyltransferase [Solirubrobacter ginsenosidimutans]MDA0159511.1 glycosyltransferase [Solirubrobacter ginsenosidimutans]